MAYRVELLRTAAKELERLPTEAKQAVRRAIAALADDPRPRGSKKLVGGHDYYRIRIGDYRVLYEVRARQVLVLVIAVGHRRDIYR